MNDKQFQEWADQARKKTEALKMFFGVLGVVVVIGIFAVILVLNHDSSEDTQRDKQPTTPGSFSISPSRYEKYYGQAAREEAIEFLKKNGTTHPTETEIQFTLKLNERLEYHAEREKARP